MADVQNQSSGMLHPAARIDSHQHFWKYNAVRDSWITDDMSVIQRDFYPGDLWTILKENQIDGCVSVQADQSEDETNFLLALAAQNSFIKGVVGWVDLKADNLEEKLYNYSKFAKLKGFRHVVQAESDGFLLHNEFQRGIKALQGFNFTYDILVYARQLEEVVEFVKAFPSQKFVIDHIAKPSIKDKEFSKWAANLSRLATFDNVSCKLSGMVTEADWKNWKPMDFEPYLNHVLECFGTSRLMYGSDWPVCLVAATYAQQLKLVEGHLSQLSNPEKESIMGGNATRFYNL